MNSFTMKNQFVPAGDQPRAIAELSRGILEGLRHQTLLGVTGSGKTFTVANVIARLQKPTLVIAHNKTLAAQLAQEYKEFFPDNAVHYFVSYYDYYQPEAYLPTSDTYIEKDAQINEEIDRLRHATTQALLTRRDVIIVASVSCIYGIGAPAEYERRHLKLSAESIIARRTLLERLVDIHFTRTGADLLPGTFRVTGSKIEIMPMAERILYTITLEGDRIREILAVDPVSQTIRATPKDIFIFPAKHFLTPEDELKRAIRSIRSELADQLKKLKREGKNLEAERLKRRTQYDLAMLAEVGYCNGIENYSRHLSGKGAGEPPDTLLSYFPRTPDGSPDFLTVIDESHVTIPQLRGMQAGDASRKETLVEHGFRLPSARDNRPLTFDEFDVRVGQRIYTSATPSDLERNVSEQIVEQVVRPTGLLDPELTVKPVMAQSEGTYAGQIKDFISETQKVVTRGERVIATTLTKKMAEDLSTYLREQGIRAEYLHSDIKTIDRIKILSNFRRGAFDCLVGVNLLREGLDLPEVSFIGILDADKEGFLRSETSLIQIIGRAARNAAGRVTLYADTETLSLKRAVEETNRRRKLQIAYNEKHGITPTTIIKKIRDITDDMEREHDKAVETNVALDRQIFAGDTRKLIRLKEREMNAAVKELNFETAAILRDEIAVLKKRGVPSAPRRRT